MNNKYMYNKDLERDYLQRWDKRNKKVDRIFKIAILSLAACLILFAVYNTVVWPESVNNPVNDEYVNEVAFNLDIKPDSVTQAMFNARYGKPGHFTISPK